MKKKYQYVVLASILMTTTLTAQSAAGGEEGYHKHDGFFLNLMGGAGALNFTETAGSNKLTIGGISGHFGVKLGGAISDNVVLFGALDGFTAFNPSATITLNGVTASGTLTNYTYSANMIGAGIAFYTDSNFFISATAGYASGTLSYKSGSTSVSASLDGGFGANINLGVEWWVSKDWGIGAALVGHYSSVKDASNPVSQYYGGVSFTATYN